MRNYLFLLCLLLLITGYSFAQEIQTPYQIALERIEAAERDRAIYLDLRFINLAELPPEIGRLDKLQTLRLEGNSLNSLPSEIGNLTNLLLLSVSVNRLTTLLPEIGKLDNLQELYLGGNQLRRLPPEIGNLSNLIRLDLSGNQLETLPSEIANLSRLCHLDLRNNIFEAIPLEIAPLNHLATSNNCYGGYRLHIDDSLLDTLPNEVVEGGTSAIFAYLDNVAWWHLQRLILSGASAVGGVTLAILGWRWTARRGKTKRKNEA